MVVARLGCQVSSLIQVRASVDLVSERARMVVMVVGVGVCRDVLAQVIVVGRLGCQVSLLVQVNVGEYRFRRG